MMPARLWAKSAELNNSSHVESDIGGNVAGFGCTRRDRPGARGNPDRPEEELGESWRAERPALFFERSRLVDARFGGGARVGGGRWVLIHSRCPRQPRLPTRSRCPRPLRRGEGKTCKSRPGPRKAAAQVHQDGRAGGPKTRLLFRRYPTAHPYKKVERSWFPYVAGLPSDRGAGNKVGAVIR